MKQINITELKTIIDRVLPNYPVAFAYVFGSVAKKQTHGESDLDIALGFSKKIEDDLFYKIFNKLASELKIRSEELDLKNFAELPLSVRFRVIRDGSLIYLKDEKIHRGAALKTLNFYHDEHSIRTKYGQLSLTRIANK